MACGRLINMVLLGGLGYFDEIDGSKKMVELEGMQTEVDLRAPWSVASAY
jgi:hypothetical protein